MKQYLLDHCQKYPKHTLIDEMKFIYQAINGGGHLVKDEKQSLERILLESKQQDKVYIQIEPLSEKLCRYHFGHLSDIEAKVLNRMFEYSANHFKGDLNILKATLEQLKEEKTIDEQKEIEMYIQKGMPMVSHSEKFRLAYQPSYRVILRTLLPYYPLLLKIEESIATNKRCIIAIDGRCGSGKSTLGAMISEMFHIPCVMMDDFFLPLNKRTQERLNEAGGNVDYERFVQEVKHPLLQQQDVSYRFFDCSKMDFNGTKDFAYQNVCLIEGSYAMHPEIVDMYDLKVFLTIPKEIQAQRILERNGAKMFERFKNEWIPMEEKYFSTYDIINQADFIIDNSKENICSID